MDNAFLNPDYPRWLADYAVRAAERYRGRIHVWTPLNEPRMTAWHTAAGRACGRRTAAPGTYRQGRRPLKDYLVPMGLWQVDPETLDRIPTALVKAYRDLVTAGTEAVGPLAP